MEISPPCDRSVTIITLIPLICASRITQNTTCPTCRTPFVTPPPGGEERVGEEQLSEAQQASFAAFIDNNPLDAMRVFLHGTGPSTSPASGERDGETSPDEEPELVEEAHFDYDHDREEFSGMYS